jgi:hypothetical protein
MGQRCDATFEALWTGRSLICCWFCAPDFFSILHHRCPGCGTLLRPPYCGKSRGLPALGFSRNPFPSSLAAAFFPQGQGCRLQSFPHSPCILHLQVETDAEGVALAQSYEVVETALQPKVACTLGAGSEKAYKMALSSDGSSIAVAIEVCRPRTHVNVAPSYFIKQRCTSLPNLPLPRFLPIFPDRNASSSLMQTAFRFLRRLNSPLEASPHVRVLEPPCSSRACVAELGSTDVSCVLTRVSLAFRHRPCCFATRRCSGCLRKHHSGSVAQQV